MTIKLYPFPSFLHPAFGNSVSVLPLTRDGVRLVPSGELVPTEEASFAELTIRTGHNQQQARGICGLVAASAFLDGTVHPHEKTLLARLQRQEATVLADGGALGKPVLLTAPNLNEWWQKVDSDYHLSDKKVIYNGQNNDYQLRTFQPKSEAGTAPLSLDFAGPLVIADGHHRAETHARLSSKGERVCDFIPVCIIGGNELTIGAFTRVVDYERPLPELLSGLREFFSYEAVESPLAPTQAGEWLMVFEGSYYRLLRKADNDKSIDSEWLDHTVLPRTFGIEDTRTDARIVFEPTPDPQDGILQFPSEAGKVYLCGFPLPVDSFFAEVKAGHCLPPKSTRFEPRVPSGLVVWQPQRTS
ncbi:DUF1015 domain-containing protein [Neolewinella aurantiaca]|uniref:DUF1015 domain-containing protein n=1 Tax=Neolewinella aurantiaca TaxID=2602767 RepID=A0A5C7FKT6_9BACT|nr:DUF1015 family protein [Neolewinella aurantiaca]TXF86689.1 DUF1015 domain-containing protein [Neolewinella aurantiaca]